MFRLDAVVVSCTHRTYIQNYHTPSVLLLFFYFASNSFCFDHKVVLGRKCLVTCHNFNKSDVFSRLSPSTVSVSCIINLNWFCSWLISYLLAWCGFSKGLNLMWYWYELKKQRNCASIRFSSSVFLVRQFKIVCFRRKNFFVLKTKIRHCKIRCKARRKVRDLFVFKQKQQIFSIDFHFPIISYWLTLSWHTMRRHSGI